MWNFLPKKKSTIDSKTEFRPLICVWSSDGIDGPHHREEGPSLEWADGSKLWYLNGVLHCNNGPAIEWFEGASAWYVHGALHRENGPAIVKKNGMQEWWINGSQLTEEEFNQWLAKEQLNKNLHNNLVPKQKTRLVKI
jgi:hypothetical protein